MKDKIKNIIIYVVILAVVAIQTFLIYQNIETKKQLSSYKIEINSLNKTVSELNSKQISTAATLSTVNIKAVTNETNLNTFITDSKEDIKALAKKLGIPTYLLNISN